MENLSGNWIGNFFGTNSGNVFAKFVQENENITGEVILNDDKLGISNYNLEGTIGQDISFKLIPEDEKNPEIEAMVKLLPNGLINGEWGSTIGTRGVLVLSPQFSISESRSDSIPRVYTINEKLGVIRMTKEGMEHILIKIKEFFQFAPIIVSYSHNKREHVQFADDFLKSNQVENKVDNFNISVQETGRFGISNVLNIKLFKKQNNSIYISGTQETWLESILFPIKNSMAQYESKLLNIYKKYITPILLIIILYSMFPLIPEIQTISARIIFVFSFLIIWFTVAYLHYRYIPYTIIYLKKSEKGKFKKLQTILITSLIHIVEMLIVGLIYFLIGWGT